jgi:hypothetical protein
MQALVDGVTAQLRALPPPPRGAHRELELRLGVLRRDRFCAGVPRAMFLNTLTRLRDPWRSRKRELGVQVVTEQSVDYHNDHGRLTVLPDGTERHVRKRRVWSSDLATARGALQLPFVVRLSVCDEVPVEGVDFGEDCQALRRKDRVSFKYANSHGHRWSYDLTVVRGDVDDEPHPERDIDDDVHAPCPDDQGAVSYEVELELVDWPTGSAMAYTVESSMLKVLDLIEFMEPDQLRASKARLLPPGGQP